MVPGAVIQNFNIWVKWIDIYGNLYGLYLHPGNAVDIKLCFIKKPLLKEDIADGFGAIIEALPKKMPNEKPNWIVLK